MCAMTMEEGAGKEGGNGPTERAALAAACTELAIKVCLRLVA